MVELMWRPQIFPLWRTRTHEIDATTFEELISQDEDDEVIDDDESVDEANDLQQRSVPLMSKYGVNMLEHLQ